MTNYLAIATLFFLPLSCSAEIYGDIYPLETLLKIKEKYPNAHFSKIIPGWATKYDAMYSIEGAGMAGKIFVKFDDIRPHARELMEHPTLSEEEMLYYKEVAEKNDDESLTVSWVRWIPQKPIPVTRFIAKYGKPEKSGFSSDDFEPYREWTIKGLTAYLSDDEKNVFKVDYSFTKAEQRAAYKAKGWAIPVHLK